MRASTFGHKCPADPGHGYVIPRKDPGKYGWYCPHVAHDGRLRTHPDGPAPRTRASFTTEEVELGMRIVRA